MTDDEEFMPQQEQDFGEDLYKKWFRSKTQAGFLSIRPWIEVGKAQVDIGELNPGGGVKSHTDAWVPMIPFTVYLRAVADGRGKDLFPKNDYQGIPTPEGFVHYGGKNTEKGAISRILKIHHWQNGENYDDRSFVWKTGVFQAKASNTGAFIPDYQKPISTNLIKVTRTEMAEIAYRCDLAIVSHVAHHEDWANHWNGKRK